MPKMSHMHVDLTGDDDHNEDSLSDLSDIANTSAPPITALSTPASSKQPPTGTLLPKSASSSSLSKPPSKSRAAPRLSEPQPKKSKAKTEGIVQRMKKTANNTGKSSPQRSNKGNAAHIDEVVSSRTHVNTGEEGSAVKLCHHHHQSCKGALLECTYMRAPGKRCQKRYCFSVLKRIYDQDPDTIVRSGRLMINPDEHCPPNEAKYAWKCPGCRGNCNCAVCRKAVGLTPLGQWNNMSKVKNEHGETVDASDSDVQAGKVVESVRPNKLIGGLSKKSPAMKSKTSSSTQKGASVLDDTATSSGSVAKSPKKTGTLALTSVVKPRMPVFKRLIPPTAEPAPILSTIATKLPDENLRARMWIYESFVRFDKIGLSRHALAQLDKFDLWTHALVQEMLACLLKTIAGLTHIEKGQPTKPFAQVIMAYRRHAKNLQRGEPWSAATELLRSLGIALTPLEFVDHSVPVEVEMLAAQRSPSPAPMHRVTRARRAKESNHTRIATQMSLLNDWEENGFEDFDNDDDEPPKKRVRGNTRKSIYVYDDEDEGSDEDAEDPDVSNSNARRSARAKRTTTKAASPEVRLTGRQQTLKIQQEQQKETEEQVRLEVQHQARERQQARTQNKVLADISDISMEDVKDESNQVGSTSAMSAADGDDQLEATEQVEFDLESKVAIIHSLIDASLVTEPLSEELKMAGDNIAVMERSQKVEHAEMEKEIAEELSELNKRAPSIVAPEYQVWKAEKAQLENDIAWRRLDSRVITGLAVDTHSLRTGSLGTDADGREYWHLREYQERMPKFTEGRYAWCLIVLGKPFHSDAEAETNKIAATFNENDSAAEAKVADDSGLTSLDSDDASNEHIALLHRNKKNGITLDPPTTEEAAPQKLKERECMGTNDPAAIKTLADFVNYRVQQVEYEENVAMQDREREVRMGKEGMGSGSQPGTPSKQPSSSTTKKTGEGVDLSNSPESMYAIRKAKQQLKDSQEERRNAIHQLVQRLHKSKDYFAWHRMELPPSASTTS